MTEPTRIAPYTLELTLDEAQGLLWLASRYGYAEGLWNCTEVQEDESGNITGFRIAMTEAAAWEFRDAVEAEDGWLPCCGGTLAEKIAALLERIV